MRRPRPRHDGLDDFTASYLRASAWRVRVTETALPLRLSGAVWGHLVGDAIGVPYEFREPAQIGEVRFGETGTHGQPPGTWSDDGALMLALLDSLLTVGFDPEDQGRRARAWAEPGQPLPACSSMQAWSPTRQSHIHVRAGGTRSSGGVRSRGCGRGLSGLPSRRTQSRPATDQDEVGLELNASHSGDGALDGVGLIDIRM